MNGKRETIAEVGLLIYPDCQMSAIHGLTDLFRIAGEWASAPGIRVSHWQAGPETVDCVYDTHAGPHRLSYLITPPSIIMPDRMSAQPVSADWMRGLHAQGTTLCSVCAGAFLLAETGLVEGRRATTHWAFARTLSERYPGIRLAEENMIVDEGDIITAGGILAWTDLGLTLVERLLGPSTMLATARFLLVEPPRASQRPFTQFIPRFDHGDTAILRAQHHIHANAATNVAMKDLHDIAAMTERTFLRRFQSATGHRPNGYFQQVRIAKAREALELGTAPVDSVAWDVGYSDAAAFRKLFRKLTGMSPVDYRKTFGRQAMAPQ
ncbi:MAG: GlxA family transcriptional regulator [Roseovarius sp.]|uniref:GlxA family transcriptional regulator n=1 Tax=Roseovarius sp. TaxID=1486281 RepID=UPI0032EEB021